MNRRRFWFRQFGLADMLILMAVVATWIACFVYRDRNQKLEVEIQKLRATAGELFVDDESRYHAIARLSPKYHDESWQVFLPEPGEHRLSVCIRGIPKGDLFPTEGVQSAVIPPGLHRIDLINHHDDQLRLHYLIQVDGRVLLDLLEPQGTPSTSSSHGVTKTPTSMPTTDPLTLKRQRNYERTATGSTPPGEQADGLLLWITPSDADQPSPSSRPAAH